MNVLLLLVVVVLLLFLVLLVLVLLVCGGSACVGCDVYAMFGCVVITGVVVGYVVVCVC